MPFRRTTLVTNQFYHIFNRGLDRRPIFKQRRDYQRFLETLIFYRRKMPVKLSLYEVLPHPEQLRIMTAIREKIPFAKIICYCLLPNHFHLLLQQTQDHGISNYLRHLSDSFTRFFNTKYDRQGPLFQDRFKAVLVESDEQLWHLSRYIHLNPLTAYLVRNFEKLYLYQWSSLHEYLAKEEQGICTKSIILSHFRKLSYNTFLKDQVDYQRQLDAIKHLLLE